MPGDRIVRLGATPIKDVDDLKQALASIEQPGSLELKLVRPAAAVGPVPTARELTYFIDVPPWIRE